MKRCRRLVLMGVLWVIAASCRPEEGRDELVVAAWGGRHEEGWRKSLIPTFEKMYGARIIWVPGLSGQTVAKLRARKDNPQIDVAMMDDLAHRQAVALDLVDRIDRSRLINASALYDLAPEPDDYGIGFALTAAGLYYNTKAFADNRWDAPTSWLDLFRPELKGRISVHSISNTNGVFLLLALNRAAGGSETNVDPGFARVRDLAAHVLTFDRLGETPTLIQQGTAVMGTWFIDAVANLAVTGIPVRFVFPREGAWGVKQIVTIVKGRTNQDLIYKFIDLLLSKEQQENTARFVGLSPINRGAELDSALASKMVYADEYIGRLQIPNLTLISTNRAAWTERWNKEIERR